MKRNLEKQGKWFTLSFLVALYTSYSTLEKNTDDLILNITGTQYNVVEIIYLNIILSINMYIYYISAILNLLNATKKTQKVLVTVETCNSYFRLA